MKLTRNWFRLLCGVALALAGAAMLMAISQDFFSPTHRPGAAGPHMIGKILGVGLMMLSGGIGVCFEFKSDPPPKKDPWEE